MNLGVPFHVTANLNSSDGLSWKGILRRKQNLKWLKPKKIDSVAE